MKSLIKQKLKRLTCQYLIWSRRFFIHKSDALADEYERTTASICRKLMTRLDTKFSIAPLSDKRYIINDNLGMFIVIEPEMRTIELTNHVYHYVTKMSEKQFKGIKKTFDEKVEAIRIQYETEIHNRIQHSLVNVLEKLNS